MSAFPEGHAIEFAHFAGCCGVACRAYFAKLHRITRQILHVERDIVTIDAERHTLLASDIAQLHLDAEASAREHRDLLNMLATSLTSRSPMPSPLRTHRHQISARGK